MQVFFGFFTAPHSTHHIFRSLRAGHSRGPRRRCGAVAKQCSRGGRVIAVGTTAVRCLESASAATGEVTAARGDTDIFIYPGYEFKVVDRLITNFHLPESTLLMLVSALSNRDNILAAYHHAVEAKYRFFSYGDAMLVDKITP